MNNLTQKISTLSEDTILKLIQESKKRSIKESEIIKIACYIELKKRWLQETLN